MTTLFDFEQAEKPTYTREIRVPHPVDPDSIAGHVGRRGDDYCFSTKRTRGVRENGECQFFRKYEGYGLSDRVIHYLTDNGVSTVFIEETDTGTLLEFQLIDWQKLGFPVEYVENDPQHILPVSRALRTWDDPSLIQP